MSAIGSYRAVQPSLWMSAFRGKANITLRLRPIGFLFRLRHSGRFAPADCFPGAILVSVPDASNDNVGDHTHDRGDDQHHQELAHGIGLLTTEQRKPVLYPSLRGCFPALQPSRSDVCYWHLADIMQTGLNVRFRG